MRSISNTFFYILYFVSFVMHVYQSLTRSIFSYFRIFSFSLSCKQETLLMPLKAKVPQNNQRSLLISSTPISLSETPHKVGPGTRYFVTLRSKEPGAGRWCLGPAVPGTKGPQKRTSPRVPARLRGWTKRHGLARPRTMITNHIWVKTRDRGLWPKTMITRHICPLQHPRKTLTLPSPIS